MRLIRHLRHRIERLPPYPSLALLVGPLAVAEPLKLATVFIVGKGHWLAGVIAMLCAYAVSLLALHWLFGIVKPRLLELPWFAALWSWLVRLWRNFWGRLRGLRTPQRRLRRPTL
jgi:hypothetical protein